MAAPGGHEPWWTLSQSLCLSLCPVLPSAAADLFTRTVALVTDPGQGQSAILWLPKGAYVILLVPHNISSPIRILGNRKEV